MSSFGSFGRVMKGISAGANNFNSSFQNGGSGGSQLGSPQLQQQNLEADIEEIMKKLKAKEKESNVTAQGTVVDYRF